MSQTKLDDLYDRLTSRKFLLTLLALVFALWNHLEGRLSAVEFQTAVTVTIGAYVGGEALTDAAASRSRPPTDQITEDAIRIRAERLAREHAEKPTTLREVG